MVCCNSLVDGLAISPHVSCRMYLMPWAPLQAWLTFPCCVSDTSGKLLRKQFEKNLFFTFYSSVCTEIPYDSHILALLLAWLFSGKWKKDLCFDVLWMGWCELGGLVSELLGSPSGRIIYFLFLRKDSERPWGQCRFKEVFTRSPTKRTSGVLVLFTGSITKQI